MAWPGWRAATLCAPPTYKCSFASFSGKLLHRTAVRNHAVDDEAAPLQRLASEQQDVCAGVLAEPAVFAIQARCASRNRSHHGERRLQRQTDIAHEPPKRIDHVDVHAGQRAPRIDQLALMQADSRAVQLEL